ncbi:hypothetical protein NC653_033987 [Populus alba x Populus x berolinensis]|uniref:Uncharacterized protein n=1 Tax=Populus alba x Populus x berolinensis TaxID=444605 RepID=A0AAD6LVB4_9ROSI|nr:hypothetical protein NC653_033987 [Populus alba x Populus x berolinensis]
MPDTFQMDNPCKSAKNEVIHMPKTQNATHENLDFTRSTHANIFLEPQQPVSEVNTNLDTDQEGMLLILKYRSRITSTPEMDIYIYSKFPMFEGPTQAPKPI